MPKFSPVGGRTEFVCRLSGGIGCRRTMVAPGQLEEPYGCEGGVSTPPFPASPPVPGTAPGPVPDPSPQVGEPAAGIRLLVFHAAQESDQDLAQGSALVAREVLEQVLLESGR